MGEPLNRIQDTGNRARNPWGLKGSNGHLVQLKALMQSLQSLCRRQRIDNRHNVVRIAFSPLILIPLVKVASCNDKDSHADHRNALRRHGMVKKKGARNHHVLVGSVRLHAFFNQKPAKRLGACSPLPSVGILKSRQMKPDDNARDTGSLSGAGQAFISCLLTHLATRELTVMPRPYATSILIQKRIRDRFESHRAASVRMAPPGAAARIARS